MFSKMSQNMKVLLGTGAVVLFSAYTLNATNPSQKAGHGLFDSSKPEDVQVSIDKKRAQQIEESRKNVDEQDASPPSPVPEPKPVVVDPAPSPEPEQPRQTFRLQQPKKGPLDPKAELFFRKAQIFKNMEEDFAWQEEQERKKWKEAQEKKKNTSA